MKIQDKENRIQDTGYKVLVLFIIAFTLFLFSAYVAYAAGGDIMWQYRDAQTGTQEAKAAVVDSSGNIIITGYSDASGVRYYYTVKVKADGSGVLWRKTYADSEDDDPATAIALDSDDNIIVTGYIWNGSSYDYHTTKYKSSDGTVLWQHTFNTNANGNDYATAIAVDSLNNVYVGGNSQGSNGADDFMIVKYGSNGPNPDGTPIWQKSYNGSANGHDRITSITAGTNGIAVTGTSQNSMPDFDILTVKYGFDSTLLWEQRKSVSGDDKGIAVRMDSSSNVIMTGYTYNGSNRDLYTAKYDSSNGIILWKNTYNGGYGEEPVDMWLDLSGNVYVAGDTFTIDGTNDIYAAKYASGNGELQWDEIFNSDNSNSDKAVCIVGDNAGNLFIAGDTFNDAAGNYDYQTLKYTAGSGTLLWQKSYNGTANKNDRALGVGLTSSGEPVIGGWSDAWTSDASDYDYYAIKYDPGLINPPTSLSAATVSSSEISLSWADNSPNEDGFKIERKIGDMGEYSQIDTVGADVTTYSNTGLTEDTKYYYRVKAYNASQGGSLYSNEAYTVTTVVSYSSPVWTYTYNGADNGDDYVTAMAAGPDNHPVATGYSYSTAGQFDYYTVKLDRQTAGVTWGARYDSDQNDQDVAKTIVVDGNNDVLVSGYSYLFGGGGENTNDIYTIKYPPTGAPQSWADQYNGPAGDDDRSSVVDVSSDGNNSYVVVGYGRNADWDDDIYVVKYLNDGTRQWAATPYNGGGHDYPSTVAFDSSGDIFVTGYTKVGSYYNYFTGKYNGSTGAAIWTDVYNGAGTGDDFARSLAVDLSGNVFVAGSSVTTSGNEDFYIIKYNGATGARIWERSYNGAANDLDEAIKLKVDPINGDITIVGTTTVGADNYELHARRYDTDGNLLWERTLDRPAYNDFAVDAAMDVSGNIFITGTTNNGVNDDIIAVQYDHEGNFVRGTIYNGAASGHDEAAAITANNAGDVFAGGYTTNAGGNADYVIMKINGDDLLTPTSFAGESTDYTQIDLSWSDNATGESGYYIERKVGDCVSTEPWVLIYTAAAGATSHSDDGLNIGATYCYRIQAYNGSGQTSRLAEVSTTTLTPQAPDGLTSTNTSTSINLTWTDNTNNETDFAIERCTGADCDFSAVTSFNPGANATTYADNTVCNTTTYRYRIKAFKTGQWATGYSNAISVTTSSIAAPGSFTATRNSEVQINLSWVDTTSDETGYKVDRCTGAECTDFAEIASLSANTTTYNNTGLTSGTTYAYRVRSYKTATCGWETTSGTASATTSVAAPSILTALAGNTTQINLTWIDNTLTENGFKIERCAGAGCSDFAEIATVVANTVTYQDTLVCNSASYNYRVRAYKAGEWDSGYSNTASATTATSAAPGSLATSGATEVKLTLTWTDATSDETGFKIERCMGEGCSDFTEIATVGINTTTYNNTGLVPSTTYGYRVRAYKSAVCSGGWNTGYSNTASGTTTTVPPPGGLTAMAADTTKIDLSWTDNTGSETGFKVERCTGTGCSDFAELAGAGRNAVSYSDTSVCNTTTYNYRVKAINEGLSGSGGGCWTRRAPLTITNFQADFQTKLTIEYDADMQADFDDIRFYDTTAFSELPHWIESKTDGISATIWVKTGANNTVYMYYGNPSATVISDGSSVFDFFDNFSGTTINTAKWIEIDPNNSIVQNNGLVLNDVSDNWEKALISNQTISRASNKMIYSKLTIAADTAGDNHFMMGWEVNQTASPSYTQLVHGFYWNNYLLNTYEKGNNTGPNTQAYAASTTYEMKVELKATGAKYYIKGGAYGSWTLVKDTSTYNDATMRVAITQYSHQATIHFITVQKYSATEPSVSAGTEESSACYTYDITWETQPSNEASATTPSISAPVLSTAAVGDSFVNLTWTDTTTDETGFVLERCTGAGCSDFTELASPGAGVTTYADTGLTLGESYSYRVKAYKTVDCGWDTEYSNINTETTLVMPPSGFIAATVSTTQVNLSWTDNTGSETGFRIERCAGAGCSDFAEVATVGANVITYQDTSLCKATDYSYRVMAYKTAEWDSGYSNTASASTSNPGSPMLIATRNSEVQINLSWTDTISDETGFKVDRCTGSGCTDFAEIASLAVNTSTYNNTGLDPSITYTYRVRAYKTAICPWEIASNTPSATTSISVPSGLVATAANTTQINLSWADNTASETGFKIERCTGGECSDFAEVANVGSNVMTYSDTSVCNSASYRYQVKAYKTGLWDSGYSGTASVTTLTISAPGSFAAAAVTDTQANLTWTDNTTDETSFKIERCTGDGCSEYSEIATVSADTTTYSDTGRFPSTTYCYRVRANKTVTCGWDTDYSNESCDLTFSAQPTLLTAAAVNSMKIRLDWTDNSNDEDGFDIEVQIFTGQFVKVATVSADAVTYTDNRSIEPERAYTYRIRAFRGIDKSPYSNEATATTPAWQVGDDTCVE